MGLKYYVNVVFMIVLHLGYSLGYERSPRETALVQVILYEPDPRSGRYSTHKTDLIGYFATVGPSRSAEGDIVQVRFCAIYLARSVQAASTVVCTITTTK